jgi:hypothetical protein
VSSAIECTFYFISPTSLSIYPAMDIRAIVNYPHTIFDSRHRKPDGNDISNPRTRGNDRQAVSKRSPTHLFRSRTSLRPQDDLLCDRCRKIDLEDVFRPGYQHAGGREIMSLGEIDLNWKPVLCVLYSVLFMFPSSQDIEGQKFVGTIFVPST